MAESTFALFISLTWLQFTKAPWGLKILVSLVTFYVLHFVFNYLWGFLGGELQYHVQYIRAAAGKAYQITGCQRVLREPDPWHSLSHDDWFFLQRCSGIDMGMMRQGELRQVLWEEIMRFLDPRRFPGIFAVGFYPSARFLC
jgi:hypothetical protein